MAMSDATGGNKYCLIGAVVYLRYLYKDNTYSWQQIAACSKVAPDSTTIVQRELRRVKMAVGLAKKLATALSIPMDLVHVYTDNTITLDQIRICEEKDTRVLNKVAATTCQNILSNISIKNIFYN